MLLLSSTVLSRWPMISCVKCGGFQPVCSKWCFLRSDKSIVTKIKQVINWLVQETGGASGKLSNNTAPGDLSFTSINYLVSIINNSLRQKGRSTLQDLGAKEILNGGQAEIPGEARTLQWRTCPARRRPKDLPLIPGKKNQKTKPKQNLSMYLAGWGMGTEMIT